ncbi:MAG: helix-turn-helix domain-containing protein [Tannerellaceae bacterium]|nr:helix-turn-helix domain-containing protein [Tannerellaceae bacterium]
MPIDLLRKIISSSESNPGWEKINPSENIKDYLEGFYIFSCADMQANHLIFNDGLPTLILLHQINDTVSIRNNQTSYKIRTGWIDGGVMKHNYINNLHSIESLFVIRFYPQAFYHLFNLPLHFFRKKSIVPLLEMNINPQLLSRIYREKDIKNKVRLISSCIKASGTPLKKNALLDTGIQYINNSKGKTTVAEVAMHIGVNYKWLERNFLTRLGISPKEYIQLQRFLYAYLNFTTSTNEDLTEIALKSGYYDYNHFLKDFKSYTGKTPLTFTHRQTY